MNRLNMISQLPEQREIVPHDCELGNRNDDHKSATKNWKAILKAICARHVHRKEFFAFLINCPNICDDDGDGDKHEHFRKSFEIEIGMCSHSTPTCFAQSVCTLSVVQMFAYDVNKLCLFYVCLHVHFAHLHFKAVALPCNLTALRVMYSAEIWLHFFIQLITIVRFEHQKLRNQFAFTEWISLVLFFEKETKKFCRFLIGDKSTVLISGFSTNDLRFTNFLFLGVKRYKCSCVLYSQTL